MASQSIEEAIDGLAAAIDRFTGTFRRSMNELPGDLANNMVGVSGSLSDEEASLIGKQGLALIAEAVWDHARATVQGEI